MKRNVWRLAAFVVVLGLAACAIHFGGHTPAPRRGPSTRAPLSVSNALVTPLAGTASCAGRACHGSLEPNERGPCSQTEFTAWVQQDPHAHAFEVLSGELAQDMAQRLGLPSAAQATVCLACHVTPALASAPMATDVAWIQRERRFGVGCEACHGNATSWLDEHLTASWTKKDESAKKAAGMTPIRNPAEMVATCAGCHVGGPGKDVNHDLIAAGHPRLAFEATSFFANLPRHWKPRPFDEPRIWALGQLVTAEASLELLEVRAKRVDSPWPDFAEYDCATCHHDLTIPSWRQDPKTKQRLGIWAWGTWPLAMMPLLAESSDTLPQSAGLKRLMERWSPPRDQVAMQAAKARVELGALRGRLEKGPYESARWAETLAQGKLLEAGPSWDFAEQTYLALYALGEADQRKRLDELIELRLWPSGKAFDPLEFARKLRE